MLTLRKENTKLASDLQELQSKHESVQKSLSLSLDRESLLGKDIQNNNEMIKSYERQHFEQRQQISQIEQFASLQSKQLKQVVAEYHGVTAQLRFLMSHLVQYEPELQLPVDLNGPATLEGRNGALDAPGSGPVSESAADRADDIPVTGNRNFICSYGYGMSKCLCLYY